MPTLHDLSAQLVELAGHAGTLRDAISGVFPDTGRGDSDRAGQLGPKDAAAFVDWLGDVLHTDHGHVYQCATTYSDLDADNARMLGGLLE